MGKIRYEPFLFMPGMTIHAVIRLKNNYVSGDKLKELMDLFNEKNNFQVPRAGQSLLIPIEENEL